MVVVLALVAAAVVGLTVLGGDDPEPGGQMEEMAQQASAVVDAREEVATAVVAADAEALGALAADQPAAFEDATDLTVGEAAGAPLGAGGYAVFAFEASAGSAYTVTTEGDGDLATALLPPEGDPVAPADVVDAAADGPHRLVVAADGDANGEVTVTVKEIEIVPVVLDEPGSLDGEVAEVGDAVAYEHEATAGAHYVVDIDDESLTVTVTDPDGVVVPTEPDIDLGSPRYVAEVAGPYRVTISAGADGETGSYSIEIFEVEDFFFYYDEESVPGLTLERTKEQNFVAPVDTAGNRAHFCLFLREGITMELTIRVTSATLDMGIDVFDETDSGPLVARVNTNGPGVSEQWAVTASEDVRRCFQLWGVDYTGGNFIVSFTTEG